MTRGRVGSLQMPMPSCFHRSSEKRPGALISVPIPHNMIYALSKSGIVAR